jgi:hypothetical protein
MQTFRDAIRRAVPGWLTGYWGYRLLYAMAIQLDALGDALAYGVKLRFPNVYSPESLPLIGRDRGISRGFEETDAGYAARLERWLYDHRRAANPYTLMRQIQGYLAGHSVKLRIVNNAGAWYTLNADGTTEYVLGGNWNWDGNTVQWSRFWLLIYPPADLWVRSGTWGDGSLWGEGTWGSTATVEQVESIRGIVAEWQAPHARCVNIILVFDAAAFDPTDAAPPLPDGTWARAPARDDRAIYGDGVQ